MPIKPTRYQLQNVATGRVFEDEEWTLDNPQGDAPSMVRPVYDDKQLKVKDDVRQIGRAHV